MRNDTWTLESFLDSLVVELDRARDTLEVKAVNRALTYAVKEVSIDLQLFPTYEEEQVRFKTAQAGEAGASRMSLQLGSITDRMVRDSSRRPPAHGDISIDEGLEDIEEVDEQTRKDLEKIGVKSTKDLERIQQRGIQAEQVGSKRFSFNELAQLIQRNRSTRLKPNVFSVNLSQTREGPLLLVEGENLTPISSEPDFPSAQVDGDTAPAGFTSRGGILVRLTPEQLKRNTNDLEIALDPHSVLTMRLTGREE